MAMVNGRKASPPDVKAEAENTETKIHVAAADTASGHAEDLTAEEARQGHTGDHVRYILMISVAGIIIAFAIAYLFYFT
jgi:hypothetical protein